MSEDLSLYIHIPFCVRKCNYCDFFSASGTKEELNAYYRHLDNIVILRDNIYTERAEGRAEGRMEEKREMVHNMKSLNIPLDTISQVTGLSIEEIKSL